MRKKERGKKGRRGKGRGGEERGGKGKGGEESFRELSPRVVKEDETGPATLTEKE